MKKIITLIIALMAFVMGSQTVHAQATETLNVIVESGMNFNDQENFDVQLAINALVIIGQINYVPLSDEVTGVTSTKTGKLLFSGTNDGFITVSADVTTNDDIFYNITEADRVAFEEAGMDELMKQYAAIKIHFVPGSGGGGNINQTAMIGTIKNGMNLEDSEYTWMAIVALTQYFNQIKMEYELDEDGEFTGGISYSSKDDKLLFILDKNNIITIADGVTSADNIIYTITQEDRDRLLEDPEAYAYFANYQTIELHFDTSGGSGDAEPSDVLLNRYALTFNAIGQTFQLEATVVPDNAADKSVTWMSDNESVATVSSTGLVTAVGEGEAYIVAATVNKIFAWCKVTVKLEPYVGGKLGTQGTWSFADGVLTVDYIGAMPQNCTSKTTDPEIAYRLKWIDFLSEIKEIVITGVDVEVQPYFLYYSGNGDLGQHPDDHIKKLTLGSGVKKVGKQAFASYDLKDVYCYGIEPPELSSDTGNGNVFWKTRLQANQAFLHLVKGASTGYARINSEWAIFNHSAHALDPEDDPVGIKDLKDSKDFKDIKDFKDNIWYTLDGRKLSGKPTQKGIYVYGGRKVVVK